MGKLYNWLWYHTEFWMKPAARRPYTYILRDFYHKSPLPAIALISGAGFVLGHFFSIRGAALVLAGVILGHLFWGTRYTPGEQEKPQYIHK